MSHPDPLYDEENTMSQDSFDRFDDMAERTIWPWIDDEGQQWDVEDPNYDDHDDFYGESTDYSDYNDDRDFDDENSGEVDWDYDDSMDGDHDSGMTSAGWGMDEDYGYYGEDY